jgi:hypothetical protein
MGTKPKKASKPAPSVVLNGNTAGAFIGYGPPQRAPARSVEYSPEITAAICEQLAEGKSLRSICEQPDMPCRTTIVRWLVAHEDFRLNYHRAREVGFDHFAEGLMRRATDVTPDMVQSVRLEVDTGKWLLSKMSKRYNDRIVQEHTGPDGGALQAQAAILAATVKLTPPEIEEGIRALLIENAERMGVTLPPGASNAERIGAIMNSGQPPTPALFRIMRGNVNDE